jgi:hypothetical protein
LYADHRVECGGGPALALAAEGFAVPGYHPPRAQQLGLGNGQADPKGLLPFKPGRLFDSRPCFADLSTVGISSALRIMEIISL